MTSLFSRRSTVTNVISQVPSPKTDAPVPAAAPPPVTPAAVMPDPDPTAPANREAQRRAQQEAMRRAGRSSTILTTPQSRSQNYSGTTLGIV